jgi:hypothetical protein
MSDSNNVQVKCRIKPIDGQSISKVSKNTVKFTDLKNPRPSKREEEFFFDKIFDKKVNQEKIFNDIGIKMCENALEG